MPRRYPSTKLIFLGAVLCGLLSSVSSFSQFRDGPYVDNTQSETSQSLRDHVGFLSSAALEGRAPGSEGEAEAAKYVEEVLRSYGCEVISPSGGEEFGIVREQGDTLRSRNVVAVVQGHDKDLYERYIVVAARLDNTGTHTLTVDGKPVTRIFYGANGNASGLAMMLELARMASTNALLLRRSIVFVALGASTHAFSGAWYFLNRSFGGVSGIDGMIDLDMLGVGEEFYAYASSNPDMTRLLGAVSSQLQPVVPEVTTQEPFPSDHRAFYSAKIPSVLFTSGQYPEYNTPGDTPSILDYDSMERKLEYIYSFLRGLANTDNPPAFTSDMVRRNDVESRVYAYYDCDTPPTFLGRSDPKFFLQKWVYEYLKYPAAAVEAGIQGQVHVRFFIEKDGTVKEAQIVKSVDPLLDEEVLKVIKASPKWKPGKVQGVKVRSYVNIPVDFKLRRRGKASFGIKK